MKRLAKQIADGILFQFLMVGSLSFSHIHDVVAAHGQAGWKAWMYPPSVDLLTVAAYRKILAARRNPDEHAGMAWFAFLLAMFASLTANVVDAWSAGVDGLALAIGIGVWPPVALLVCTMLGHDSGAPEGTAEETAEQSAPEAPEPTPAPLPAAAPVPASVPAQTATAPLPAPRPTTAPTTPRAPRKQTPGAGRIRTPQTRTDEELATDAEALERAALAASGGASGTSYRAVQDALSIGYPKAKRALDAARARITSAPIPTVVIPAPTAHANGSAVTI